MIPHNKPTLGPSEFAAAQRVLQSGWLAQGKEVEAFENEVCEFLGLAQGHAVAVSSGSAALYAALMASNNHGKFVAAPAYSCRSLWNAIELANATAIWLDTEKDTPTVSQAVIQTASAQRTIVAHMFGIPSPFISNDQFVIEDCCQALGAEIKGNKVGTIGDAGVFSFGATKLITSGGQGGMVVSNNTDFIEHIRMTRDYDTVPDRHARFNFQMTDLQAAIGREQLRKLPDFLMRRQEIFDIYRHYGLPLLPDKHGQVKPIRFRAILLTSQAQQIQSALANQGIASIIPVTESELLAPVSTVPFATAFTHSSLSIPIYPSLTDEDAVRIAQICQQGMHN